MKVIYIMGAGHSGSTLLDIVLSNHRNVVGVGELYKLHRSGWHRDDNRRCSCGKSIHDCAFWRSIHEKLSAVEDGHVDNYLNLQRKYERNFTAWLRLTFPHPRVMSGLSDYGRRTAELLEAIKEASGKSVIVDSSKIPRRAYALLQNPSVDLRVIHLVRDGRACIWSQMKPRAKDVEGGSPRDFEPVPAIRTTRNWISTNLQAEAVRAKMSSENFVRVRYEDFVRFSDDTLADIGRITGLDLEDVAADLRYSRPMSAGHSVGGNRIRMCTGLTLNPDFAWTKGLSETENRRFWSLAGWLAQRYGYEKSG